MFHVKHADLLSDAEFREDHVQQILDIDPARDAAQRCGGQTQILGDQRRLIPASGPLKGRSSLFKAGPVPLSSGSRRGALPGVFDSSNTLTV